MQNIIDLKNNLLSFSDKKVLIILNQDNTPWFKAKDVCDVLNYNNVSRPIDLHVFDEDKTKWKDICFESEHLHIHPDSIFINESGLYSLVLSSKKEEAREFKRWITSEVIPSIRKNGEYKIRNYYELKIDKLQKSLENFNLKYDKDIHEIKIQNKKIIKDLKHYYRKQRKELNEELHKLNVSIDKKQNRILELVEQLKDKIIKPDAKNKFPMVLILKHIYNDSFKTFRAQKKRTDSMIKYYKDSYLVFYYAYEPNPITFFDKTKKELIKEDKIKFKNSNDFELLNDYTTEDLLEDLDLMGLNRVS